MSSLPKRLRVAGVVLVCALAALAATPALSQSSTPITGWAWSEHIGWVSLDGSGYGLTLGADNTIGGYAWSEHIGWIRPATGGDGCPGSGATRSGNNVNGWLKVLAAADGWDGCISLSGSGYGVNLSPNTSYNPATSGAWGSDVVGWLAFNVESAACTPPAPVCLDSDTSRRANPASLTCETVDIECSPFSCSASTGACSAVAGCLSIGTSASPCNPQGRVASGNQVQLSWNISGALSCALTAPGYSQAGLPAAQSGYTPTLVIEATTIFTLTCQNSTEGDPPYIATATVGIVPNFEEE